MRKMTTIVMNKECEKVKDYAILKNWHCTCSETDVFASNHGEECGYRQWFDRWEQEYLSSLDWSNPNDD